MCTRLKLNRGIVTPGMLLQYQLLTASKQGKFGMYGGKIPNVRDDKLNTTWRNLYENNRAIVTVEAFVEKGQSFVSPSGLLQLAALYDPQGDIAIVTRDASALVIPYHHRMPMVIVGDPEPWLRFGSAQFGEVRELQLESL